MPNEHARAQAALDQGVASVFQALPVGTQGVRDSGKEMNSMVGETVFTGRRGPSRLVRTALLAALAIALVVPASAYAAKPGTGGGSWIALATVNGARTGAGSVPQPTLGSWVTFDSASPTNVKIPRIEVLCYQGGSLVYGEAGGVNDSFKLGGGGSIWLTNGGSADCTANLFYFGWHAGTQTYNKLASTSFAAN